MKKISILDRVLLTVYIVFWVVCSIYALAWCVRVLYRLIVLSNLLLYGLLVHGIGFYLAVIATLVVAISIKLLLIGTTSCRISFNWQVP